MDRRTFMMTGAWLSSAMGGAWPWFARAAVRSGTFAIVDSTLPHGAAFAAYAAHLQLPIFETGDDIGVLWYSTLAPLLAPMPMPMPTPMPTTIASRSLIGLTRVSDYFVLERLVTRQTYLNGHGHGEAIQRAAGSAHVAFAFTPHARRQP